MQSHARRSVLISVLALVGHAAGAAGQGVPAFNDQGRVTGVLTSDEGVEYVATFSIPVRQDDQP